MSENFCNNFATGFKWSYIEQGQTSGSQLITVSGRQSSMGIEKLSAPTSNKHHLLRIPPLLSDNWQGQNFDNNRRYMATSDLILSFQNFKQNS